MPEIDSIINELEKMYAVDIPKELFDEAEIYTTEDYRKRFEEKWGYSVSAAGVLMARQGWDKLKPIIHIPQYSSGRSFLPSNDFEELKSGFALIPKREDYPLWGLDHEMLHLAMCEHAKEFDQLIRECRADYHPSPELERRAIEADFINEICAFRDNLDVCKGEEEATWEWVRDGLVTNYLPNKLMRAHNDFWLNDDHYAMNISQITMIMPILQEKLEPKEITKIIFELPYENPFKELTAAMSPYI